MLDITVPDTKSEVGTLVIPGHGRLPDQSDVAYYREMVAIIRDRIQDGIKRGLTLAQIKAEKPTLDYDPRFGKHRSLDDRHVHRSGVSKSRRK